MALSMLKYLRLLAELSQEELAECTQTSQGKVQRYETNVRAQTPEQLQPFADYFQVPVETLYQDAPNPFKKEPAHAR